MVNHRMNGRNLNAWLEDYSKSQVSEWKAERVRARAELTAIEEQINYWESEVAKYAPEGTY